MIAALVVLVLAQPVGRDYLPPAEALERVFPAPWSEVVRAPESVTLEGLVRVSKRSHTLKVRWRRALDEDPQAVTAVQQVLLAGDSYKIPGPGWNFLKLCGRPVPSLRVRFSRERRVVTADICFGCSVMGLDFDEAGRRVRRASFHLADEGWLEAFAPLVQDDEDEAAHNKRRRDEFDQRTRRFADDAGVP